MLQHQSQNPRNLVKQHTLMRDTCPIQPQRTWCLTSLQCCQQHQEKPQHAPSPTPRSYQNQPPSPLVALSATPRTSSIAHLGRPDHIKTSLAPRLPRSPFVALSATPRTRSVAHLRRPHWTQPIPRVTHDTKVPGSRVVRGPTPVWNGRAETHVGTHRSRYRYPNRM